MAIATIITILLLVIFFLVLFVCTILLELLGGKSKDNKESKPENKVSSENKTKEPKGSGLGFIASSIGAAK